MANGDEAQGGPFDSFNKEAFVNYQTVGRIHTMLRPQMVPPRSFIKHWIDYGLSDAEVDDNWDSIVGALRAGSEVGAAEYDAWLRRSAGEHDDAAFDPRGNVLEQTQRALKNTFYEDFDIQKAFAPQLKKAAEGRAAAGQFWEAHPKGALRRNATANLIFGAPFIKFGPEDLRTGDAPASSGEIGPRPSPADPRFGALAAPEPKTISKTAVHRPLPPAFTSGPVANKVSWASSDQPPSWYSAGEEYERALMGPYELRGYPQSEY